MVIRKSIIFESPIETDMDLVAKDAVLASEVWGMPVVFANVLQSQYCRCEACITPVKKLLVICLSMWINYIPVKMFAEVFPFILVQCNNLLTYLRFRFDHTF